MGGCRPPHPPRERQWGAAAPHAPRASERGPPTTPYPARERAIVEENDLCSIQLWSIGTIPIGRSIVLFIDTLEAAPQARKFLKTASIVTILLLENREVWRATGAKNLYKIVLARVYP